MKVTRALAKLIALLCLRSITVGHMNIIIHLKVTDFLLALMINCTIRVIYIPKRARDKPLHLIKVLEILYRAQLLIMILDELSIAVIIISTLFLLLFHFLTEAELILD